MLKRLLAVFTTVALAVGLSLGATAPASANSETCNSIGYTKIDAPSGSESFTWGELTWSGQSLSHTLGDGWSVDLCIKSGAQAGTTTYRNVTGSGTVTIAQDISHIGYTNPTHGPGLTCDAATLYKSSPLTNGDHINMDVVIDGTKQQVNAYVDLWQAGGPTPKLSDHVLRVTPKSGAQFTVSLPQANVDSGILSFEYSSGWTGSWAVEWVQYNSSYFNQDRDSAKFLQCEKDAPVVIATAPSATAPTCDVDGTLVLPSAATITWSGGNDGDGPGTYTIVATPAAGYTLDGAQDTWVIQVLPKGTDLSCGPPPCIAASDVSYTYDPATNSGVITVADPAGSSGILCDGFWVTAVSWKYAGSGIWPQNLDQNNPMPENAGAFFVDEPGSYPYGADVECGQGDIYASYEAQPVPTAVLKGPNNPYAEHFLHEMGFTGPNPTWVQDAAGCNKATPVAPVATPITCDTDGALTFGPTTGVVYNLTTGNGRSGAWEVTATPATNHYFDGPQVVTFSGDLGTPADCGDDRAIIPLDPFASPEECVAGSLDGDTTDGSITIVKAEHVTWQISTDLDGVKHAVDTSGVGPNFVFAYPAGDYRVWATADPGYFVTTPTSFPLTVHSPTLDCDLATQAELPTGASWTQQVCTAVGIVHPTITVEAFAGVSYFLDGVKMSQATVTVKPGSYTLTAAADDPTNTVTTSSWPTIVLAAASSPICGDLTTLALTGDSPAGWLILALLLLQAGLVLLAVRFVRTREAVQAPV